MGTRGAFGFRVTGIDKVTYNHWDSYPECLGELAVNWIATTFKKTRSKAKADKQFADIVSKIGNIRLVKESDTPTPEDIARCSDFADTNVGSGSISDWYVLLRRAQPADANGIADMVHAGAMIDSLEFLNDSLFCEWAYIINIDEMLFEVYRGFQRSPHKNGRYASNAGRETAAGTYYPVALVATFPLAEVDKWSKTWIQQVVPQEKINDDDNADEVE